MITPPRPKSKNKNKKNYFTQETEDAIVLYNSTTDPILKSKIYEEQIHYAFFKLTENIIHTFKFYNTEVDKLTDLQQELIIFLLTKIHLFDPTRGSKAYSYFGTAVKRWLIVYTKKNYTKKINIIPLEGTSQDEQYASSDLDPKYKDKLSNFMDQYVEYCSKNIYELFPKDEDAKVADAVLECFRKRDELDVFNKKALYIYIREMIDVKTPKITKVAERLYKIFKISYAVYLERGYVKF